MLIDHFDSFRETCEVRDGTILLCLLCLFFPHEMGLENPD